MFFWFFGFFCFIFFNWNGLSVYSLDGFRVWIAVSVKLGRLSVGPTKLAKSGMDDLLSVADGGKHDYDW